MNDRSGDTTGDGPLLYELRDIDLPLVEAAKGLGRWLAARPECTDRERAVIARVLSFLERLPLPPSQGLDADFEFGIRPESFTKETSLIRKWCVSVDGKSFDIFSNYTDVNIDFPSWEASHELSWSLEPGGPNTNGTHNIGRWINEVSDPTALLSPGYRFEMEVYPYEPSAGPRGGVYSSGRHRRDATAEKKIQP